MRLPPERDNATWNRLREHDTEELWDHSISPHVAAAYAARVALICRLVRDLAPRPVTVVDVGCAQGTIGLFLAEDGYQVTLLDIRPEAIDYARERHESGAVEFIAGTVEDLTATAQRFDVAVCTEVLEHVRAPSTFLDSVAQLVRPGGTVIITTPNAQYLLSKLPSFGSATQATIDGAEQNSMDGDAHRYLFTLDELRTIVRGAGLSVCASGVFSPFWIQGHLKTRVIHRALYRVRKRIAAPPRRLNHGTGKLSRATCSALWLVASVR